MRPATKSGEAATSAGGMERGRQIWAENESQHDELRAVFKNLQPLVEMREIARSTEHHKEK